MFRFLVILLFYSFPPALLAETYTFAVVPQHAASKIFRQWQPVITLLSQKTGKQFEVVTSKDIPTFESELEKGSYDFAYMNPYHFTVFNNRGYRAIAKQKGKLIKGIIVVRKDSHFNTLNDLKNSNLAFPSPAAFAATLLTRGNLAGNEIPYDHQFVSSHDSVYLSVANSIVEAGGGIFRTFNGMPDDIRGKLRIMWTSDGYTPHAIAAHVRVSSNVRLAVRDALVGMVETPGASVILDRLGFNKGFEKASDQDWDDVKALNLRKLKR